MKGEEIQPSLMMPPVLNFNEGDNFFIYGAFDDSILRNIIPPLVKKVDEAAKMRDQLIVRFFINSCGGYIYVLKEILSLVELAKCWGSIVETNVMANAYSCASILAAAGSPQHRFVSPYAEHLVHLGCTESGELRNQVEATRMQQRIEDHFEFVKSVYKKYAKIKNFNKVIQDDDYFIRGEQIIDNGLADAVFTI